MISAPSVDTIISRLRPRDVSGIIDQAFRLYRKHFLTFLAIAAAVYVPTQILLLVVQLWLVGPSDRQLYTSANFGSRTVPFRTINESLVTSSVGGLVGIAILLLSLVMQSFIEGALTIAVADSHLDKPVSFGGTYRQAVSRAGSLFGYMGLQILIWIGIFIPVFLPFLFIAFSDTGSGASAALGCLALCLIFPALIFALYIFIRLSAAVPAIMIEGIGPVQAMRRSWRLVNNYWWRTLGLVLLLRVISWVITVGPVAIITFALFFSTILDPVIKQALSGTVGVLTSTFFLPLELTALTLYYFDLRVRKEGFDIDAAMNQAYPPYGGYGYPQPGYGAYGSGQVAPGPSQYAQQPQANPTYSPMLGYEQQGAGYNYAPAPNQPTGQYPGNPAGSYNLTPTPTPQGNQPPQQAPAAQETVSLGTPPASQSLQPASEPASAISSTPYGNDPLGLYPDASGHETPQEPVSGDIESGQENTTTTDVDKKGS